MSNIKTKTASESKIIIAALCFTCGVIFATLLYMVQNAVFYFGADNIGFAVPVLTILWALFFVVFYFTAKMVGSCFVESET